MHYPNYLDMHRLAMLLGFTSISLLCRNIAMQKTRLYTICRENAAHFSKYLRKVLKSATDKCYQ